jgi:D-galactarolactone cycloisomerase
MTLQLARVDAFVLRWPVATPVRTSFGTMHDRPALLVRVEDRDGAHGWGEAWCNFPACGAEHRARLLADVVAPLVVGAAFDGPADAFVRLHDATSVLALQSGEPGPLAHAIAGLDLALWDLVARRTGQPLWRLLGGTSDTIGVYASGINPDAPERVVERLRDRHRAFKLKVGFGRERDVANLARMRDAAGASASLMVDANQACPLDEALSMAHALAPFDLTWLEEPLRADVPWTQWRTLADACEMPLAAGENVAGHAAFDALIAAGAVRVVQPDAAKWGGISGVLDVARRVRAAGLRYCPHFLGAGVGLLHSAHLLAAAGGDGLLEIDANPNPLREACCGAVGQVHDGRVRLGDAPGIGVEPDLAALRAVCSGA